MFVIFKVWLLYYNKYGKLFKGLVRREGYKWLMLFWWKWLFWLEPSNYWLPLIIWGKYEILLVLVWKYTTLPSVINWLFALFVCCRKFSSISSQLLFKVSRWSRNWHRKIHYLAWGHTSLRVEMGVQNVKFHSSGLLYTMLKCSFFLSFLNKNKCLVFLQVNINLLALHL